MAFGQPYYNYGNVQNSGYMAQQIPQHGYYSGQQPPIQQPVRSNKILVTSLTDAMSRSVEPNTDILYIDQDNPYIYQVMIDTQGRKSYKTFEIKEVTEQSQSQVSAVSNINLTTYATKDDLKTLEEKLVAMANSFITPKSKQKVEKTGGEE